MRNKLSPTAALWLALIFTSTTFAAGPFTQIDRFDKELNYGISKTDFWYVMAWGSSTITNAKTGNEYTDVLNKTGSTTYAELKGINVSSGGAGIGLDFVSNKEGFAEEYGYDLTGCTDFEYDYIGDDHKICFQVKKSTYPGGGRYDPELEYQYLDPYCRDISESEDGVEDISEEAGWKKVSMTLNSLKSSSSTFNSTTDLQKVLQLQWRFESSITNGNLKVKNLKCIGKSIFMEPSTDISGAYGTTLGTLANLTEDENYSWQTGSSVSLGGVICPNKATPCEGGIIWDVDKNDLKRYYKKVNAKYTLEGEDATGSITIDVTKAEIAIPTATTPEHTYNGSPKSAGIATSNYYDILNGDNKTNADTYSAKIILQPTDAVEAGLLSWTDKTTEFKYIPWEIKTVKIAKPTVPSTPITYNGSAQSPVIATNTAYSITGNTQTNAGTYTATVALNDKVNYEWEGGGSGDLSLVWYINPAKGTVNWTSIAASPIDFGQTLANSTLSGGTATPTGTFRWENSAIKPESAGSHSYNAEFVPPNNNNYEWEGVSLIHSTAITVNKASGLAQAPASGVDLYISKSNTTENTFNLTLIGFTKSDHGNLTYKTVTVTSNTSGVLSSSPAPSITGTTLHYTGTGEESGTATVKILIESENYADVEALITFTATPKTEVAITGLTAKNTVYDGTPQTGYTGTASSGAYSGELVYEYAGTGSATYSTTKPINAGTYILRVSIPATADFVVNSTTGRYEFTIAKATVATPTGPYTATYGQKLSDVTPAFPSVADAKGTWTWVNAATTDVGNAGPQTHLANFAPTDVVNYEALTSVPISITVNKAAGAVIVVAPTLVNKTTNSITINEVAPPAEQDVEYGYSTTAAGTPATWQAGLTFSGLNANTTYYIFARSKANDNYNAGANSAALTVTTNLPSGGGGGYYPNPISKPQVAISDVRVRAIAGAIELENLPKNAKVDVFNLQGKRIYSSNSVNSQMLKVQASAGMYIIRVAVGSQVKVMRVSMK